MNDLERMRAMLHKAPYQRNDKSYYKIVKINDYSIIYLLTDDDYNKAELWFNKEGNFIGFYDPVFREQEEEMDDQRRKPRSQMLYI